MKRGESRVTGTIGSRSGLGKAAGEVVGKRDGRCQMSKVR